MKMRTVLLIVDEKGIIRPLKHYFEYLGFTVRTFSSRQRPRFKNEVPDLIILPTGNLRDFVPMLRAAQSRIPGMKIIYLAASRSSRIRRVIGEQRVSFVIQKENFYRIYQRIKQLRKR